MSTVLSQLRGMSTVVADTGDTAALKLQRPEDCTTNPSLVLNALSDPASDALIAREIEKGRAHGLDAHAMTATLTVALGAELCGLVPGRVSTEVAP